MNTTGEQQKESNPKMINDSVLNLSGEENESERETEKQKSVWLNVFFLLFRVFPRSYMDHIKTFSF